MYITNGVNCSPFYCLNWFCPNGFKPCENVKFRIEKNMHLKTKNYWRKYGC